MAEKGRITLESPEIVAFISLQTHQTPQPFLRQPDRRVAFVFTDDDETKRALADYYKNPPVPILDYTRHVRQIRSTIFSLKAVGGGADEPGR